MAKAKETEEERVALKKAAFEDAPSGLMGFFSPQTKTSGTGTSGTQTTGTDTTRHADPAALKPPVAPEPRVPVAQEPPVAHRPRGMEYRGYVVDSVNSLGNLAFVGMLFLLWEVAPSGEGWVRLGSLAKSIGMDRRAFQRNMAKLEESGLISVLEKGQKGTRVVLATRGIETTPWFCSSRTLDSENQESTTTTGGGTETRGTEAMGLQTAGVETTGTRTTRFGSKTTDRLNRKKLFFVALASNCRPEELSPQAHRIFSDVSKDRGEVWASAFFLAFLPKASKSPEGYLHRTLENGGEPSLDFQGKAKALLEGIETLQGEIGETVLPGDWVKVARQIRIDATVENCREKQAALKERLRRFLE